MARFYLRNMCFVFFSDDTYDLPNLQGLLVDAKGPAGGHKCCYCSFKHHQDFTVLHHLNAAHFKSVYFQCRHSGSLLNLSGFSVTW